MGEQGVAFKKVIQINYYGGSMLVKKGDYITGVFDKERRKLLVVGIDESQDPPKIEIQYPNGMKEWIYFDSIDEIFHSS